MTTNPSPLPPIAPTGFIGNREFILTEWRFLLFGLSMAFWSSLGQTFFISLFSGQIRAALDLSHGDFGTYYAVATTASAISLIWLGKLADMMRLEKLAVFILSSLCVAAILFSQISSLWMLVGGLYLLRMFGQGMMTHVYTTAMARRYVVTRGRAISIAQLGHTLGESIGPASIVALQAVFDWRSLWIGLPLIAFLTLAPFLRLLTQRTRLQDGEGLDGLGANHPMPNIVFGGKKQWRRTEVLRDPAFWLGFIWLAAVPSFVLTGLLFHQIYLAEAKGVALSTWTASYVLYAVFAVIGSLTIGQLIDRFRRAASPHIRFCQTHWPALRSGLDQPKLGCRYFLFFLVWPLACRTPPMPPWSQRFMAPAIWAKSKRCSCQLGFLHRPCHQC